MNNNYESEIEELAKAIYETKVCIDGTDILYGVYAQDDHYHKMARALYAMGYRKDSDVVKDVFERIIEETKAVQASGYDGLGVEDLKQLAKEVYGVEVEK